eukprot:10102021-Alexandrium_andersonii.AAC.1
MLDAWALQASVGASERASAEQYLGHRFPFFLPRLLLAAAVVASVAFPSVLWLVFLLSSMVCSALPSR